jgi:hypothetical protein
MATTSARIGTTTRMVALMRCPSDALGGSVLSGHSARREAPATSRVEVTTVLLSDPPS